MGCLGSGVYEAEDVVQDIPVAAFILELECLSVAHRLVLSVDLDMHQYVLSITYRALRMCAPAGPR